MTIDLGMGIPVLPEEDEPEEGRGQRQAEKARRMLFLGGAMNAMGSYLGPVYPMLLDPMMEDKEEDPNP